MSMPSANEAVLLLPRIKLEGVAGVNDLTNDLTSDVGVLLNHMHLQWPEE